MKKPHDERNLHDALHALDVPVRTRSSLYPDPFASLMAGRIKRQLGEAFGLKNFGVNLVVLPPGAVSALRHAHSAQDEFIYVLAGTPTLHAHNGPVLLAPGMCAGFAAGDGNAHRLVNDAAEDAVFLEVGDRSSGDEAIYPDDDLVALLVDGTWKFFHKDGRPY